MLGPAHRKSIEYRWPEVGQNSPILSVATCVLRRKRDVVRRIWAADRLSQMKIVRVPQVREHPQRIFCVLASRVFWKVTPSLACMLWVLGCSNAEDAPQSTSKHVVSAISSHNMPQLLAVDAKISAYHNANGVDRRAVVAPILAKFEEDIDRRGKSDAEIADELLPCMDSIDHQLSDGVRVRQPVSDLVAVCLVQLGFRK